MILERITFRNLLSYGNNNTVFEFGDIYNFKTIGIIGENGVGKCVSPKTEIEILIDDDELFKQFKQFIKINDIK
jgi:hypothetical protein